MIIPYFEMNEDLGDASYTLSIKIPEIEQQRNSVCRRRHILLQFYLDSK